MMTSYCSIFDDEEVPDPYYGGPQGFEHVLDLLEDACNGLLVKIKEDNPELFNT
jgi:protein-tyrosine phosphatase